MMFLLVTIRTILLTFEVEVEVLRKNSASRKTEKEVTEIGSLRGLVLFSGV